MSQVDAANRRWRATDRSDVDGPAHKRPRRERSGHTHKVGATAQRANRDVVGGGVGAGVVGLRVDTRLQPDHFRVLGDGSRNGFHRPRRRAAVIGIKPVDRVDVDGPGVGARVIAQLNNQRRRRSNACRLLDLNCQATKSR
ncbi:hypothetical protein D3C80_1229530 [compost metagenome]